jgi:hypothetical protein
MSMWACIDPNWGGDPVVLLSTIRETEEETWKAACMTDERGTNLYSGASLAQTPQIPGTRGWLAYHKYEVKQVEVRIVE